MIPQLLGGGLIIVSALIQLVGLILALDMQSDVSEFGAGIIAGVVASGMLAAGILLVSS